MKRLLLALLLGSLISMPAFAICTPVIGVSGEDPSSRTVAPLMSVLRVLGAKPRFLYPQNADAASDLAGLHALIIAGNSRDIDPARYGQTPHPETKIEENLARAEYEYAAIEWALEHKLPLLGICGGMQRILVSGPAEKRGSLQQHVEGQNQAFFEPPVPPYNPTEIITLKNHSKLAALAEQTHLEKTIAVNSYHHQVPDKIRQGFRASATSEHDTVEAIEPDPQGPYTNQYAIGVMWHPEFSADDLSIALLRSVVDVARMRACGGL